MGEVAVIETKMKKADNTFIQLFGVSSSKRSW
jgi:hypothetical protein